jgi:REP element-mobilizing transposase RayT
MDASQEHTRWNCRYHIVWAPRFRRKNHIRKVQKRNWGDIPETMPIQRDRNS